MYVRTGKTVTFLKYRRGLHLGILREKGRQVYTEAVDIIVLKLIVCMFKNCRYVSFLTYFEVNLRYSQGIVDIPVFEIYFSVVLLGFCVFSC